jgi:hypothetical protein
MHQCQKSARKKQAREASHSRDNPSLKPNRRHPEHKQTRGRENKLRLVKG